MTKKLGMKKFKKVLFLQAEKKEKKIFTNKLQLKRYLSSREIDLRISQEAYEEIERQMQDVLHHLIEESQHRKNVRKAKILSGQDVLLTMKAFQK